MKETPHSGALPAQGSRGPAWTAPALTPDTAGSLLRGREGRVVPAASTALVVRIATAAGLLLIGLLAFANLTTYPAMWFDEGIHLHVPKALVTFGVYADYSSEGFRYYGPTMSVGPTVMLPVALAFEVAGIGLLQARLVMVGFMLAALVAYWLVARRLGGRGFAALALALMVSSRGVDYVYFGRQLLGEVPGLLFVLAGLWCWFRSWDRATVRRAAGLRSDGWLPDGWLAAAGVLFGLAVVTKYQYLILLVPGIAGAFVLDRVYYRLLPWRAFVWPSILLVAAFAGWQLMAMMYLGPSMASSNWQTMRQATAGAALSFSTVQMWRAFTAVITPTVFSSLLLPALLYVAYRSLDRSLASFRWMTILCFIAGNLGWFVLASIGWPRYAFAAFALGALFVARLAIDAWSLARREPGVSVRSGHGATPLVATRSATGGLVASGLVAVVVAGTILAPLALTLRDVLQPPPPAAREMANQLSASVPLDAEIETWEPEMGFLTDHRFHYPPPELLIRAVSFVWTGGRAPADDYDFRTRGLPAYVLEGPFARWVGVYPASRLEGAYRRTTTIGGYVLYERLPGH